MNDLFIFCGIYFAIVLIVAKLLFYYEKWDRKTDGIHNWDEVNPTVSIFLGLLWPMTLPVLVIAALIWMTVSLIRLIFFRA